MIRNQQVAGPNPAVGSRNQGVTVRRGPLFFQVATKVATALVLFLLVACGGGGDPAPGSLVGDYFFLMYSVLEDGEFRSFTLIRGDAGNPTMSYIPSRNAILALYGADYKGTGAWRVRAAVMPLGGSWQDKGVVLSKAGIHIADPDLGIGHESYPLIISVGSYQSEVSTYLFHGCKIDLYDSIISGSFSFEDLGVTMK